MTAVWRPLQLLRLRERKAVTRPGLRAGETAVEKVVEELEAVKEHTITDHMGVLQLLDNVADRAITTDDSITPCRKDNSGGIPRRRRCDAWPMSC
jgi:hypothetical protein